MKFTIFASMTKLKQRQRKYLDEDLVKIDGHGPGVRDDLCADEEVQLLLFLSV